MELWFSKDDTVTKTEILGLCIVTETISYNSARLIKMLSGFREQPEMKAEGRGRGREETGSSPLLVPQPNLQVNQILTLLHIQQTLVLIAHTIVKEKSCLNNEKTEVKGKCKPCVLSYLLDPANGYIKSA